MTIDGAARENEVFGRCHEVFSSRVETPDTPFIASRKALRYYTTFYIPEGYYERGIILPELYKRLRRDLAYDIFNHEGIDCVQLILDSDELPWLSMGRTPHYIMIGRAPLQHKETSISAMKELVGIVNGDLERLITEGIEGFRKRLESLGFKYTESGTFIRYSEGKKQVADVMGQFHDFSFRYDDGAQHFSGYLDPLSMRPMDEGSEKIFRELGISLP